MRLTWLGLPGAPGLWEVLGFAVDGDTTRIAGVAATLDAPELAWGFDGFAADPAGLEVPTELREPPAGDPPVHPNGVDRIDHVVYAVPDLGFGIAAMLAVLDLEPRRRLTPREGGPEMAFFRAGEAVLEVVGAGAGPALWGVALGAPDLDAFVACVRERGGEIPDPKPAIQGGRIVSVPGAQLGLRLAVMEPPPR